MVANSSWQAVLFDIPQMSLMNVFVHMLSSRCRCSGWWGSHNQHWFKVGTWNPIFGSFVIFSSLWIWGRFGLWWRRWLFVASLLSRTMAWWRCLPFWTVKDHWLIIASLSTKPTVIACYCAAVNWSIDLFRLQYSMIPYEDQSVPMLRLSKVIAQWLADDKVRHRTAMSLLVC